MCAPEGVAHLSLLRATQDRLLASSGTCSGDPIELRPWPTLAAPQSHCWVAYTAQTARSWMNATAWVNAVARAGWLQHSAARVSARRIYLAAWHAMMNSLQSHLYHGTRRRPLSSRLLGRMHRSRHHKFRHKPSRQAPPHLPAPHHICR